MQIAIKDIRLSPYQARDIEQDPDLESLAASLKEYGQLAPILVRPNKPDPTTHEVTGYECIFGHRRLRASELAGFETIEALVGWEPDERMQILGLIENTQRKDLEVLELANGLASLKDSTGWSNREMGRRLGIPEAKIREHLDLLSEPIDIQGMVAACPARTSIGLRHVREARLVLPDKEERAEVLRKAAREDLSRDRTRKLAERYRDAETPEQKARVLEVPAKKQEALETIQEDLRQAEERAERIRPPMTPTTYWAKWEAVEEQIKKLALAGRQVEIWTSTSWPVTEACLERIVREIERLLEEGQNG